MPELTWPWVLVLSLALLAVFLLLNAYLRREQNSRSKPRHKLSDSTMPSSWQPQLPPLRRITHSSGHPPWEDQETEKWDRMIREGKHEEVIEEEIAQRGLIDALTREPKFLAAPIPENPWWLDETPSLITEPKRFLIPAKVNPAMTMKPARTIKKIENSQLILF